MKAVSIRRYGGPEVLEYGDLPPPKAKENEVVVKVSAAGVNPIDWKIRNGALKMFIRSPFPIILGVDLAGEIVELGRQVKDLAVGDRVFVMMPGDIGAQAELVAVSADLVARAPKDMSWEEAASVPASALTSLQSLRDFVKLEAGQRALINGASGGVGIFGVQIAKILGAHVTAVCSEANFTMVKNLGADRLIDYTKTDFTTEAKKYDVVFDCIGNLSPGKCRKILSPGAAFMSTAAAPGLFLRQLINFLFPIKVHTIIVKSKGSDLAYLGSLIEKGLIKTVIDKVYPIADVAEAQKHSATGRAKGKIVLKFGT